MSEHTDGRLLLYTSNSWRRFCNDRGDSVCEPVTQRSDGHPDLHFRNGGPDGPDARRIIACWDVQIGVPTAQIANDAVIFARYRVDRNELIAALQIAQMAIEQGLSLIARVAANGPTVGETINKALDKYR